MLPRVNNMNNRIFRNVSNNDPQEARMSFRRSCNANAQSGAMSAVLVLRLQQRNVHISPESAMVGRSLFLDFKKRTVSEIQRVRLPWAQSANREDPPA